MTAGSSAARWACAAGLLVAALVTVAAQSPMFGFALLAVGAVSLAIGPRFKLGINGQATLGFAALVVAVVMATLAAPEDEVSGMLSGRVMLFLAPPLCVAFVRTLVAEPVGGVRVTLALLVIALTGAGRSRTGELYPAAVAAFVAAASTALVRDLHGRLNAGRMPRRARDLAVLVLALALTGGIGTAMARTLPVLQAAIIERFVRATRDRVGFSTSLSLGSLQGLLESEAVVLRVHRGEARYLRGAIFRRYDGSTWDAAASTGALLTRAAPTEPESESSHGMVEIEMARPMGRYFAPLGTDVVALSAGVYERGDAGLFAPVGRYRAKRLWLAPAPADRRDAATDVDRLVPARMMPLLTDLVLAWDATSELSPRQRLARIEHALSAGYSYSLTVDRTEGVDPLVDFLTSHRQGHCEYFASAMVLLARAAGVPARLVTGFRADERSPLGSYVIVRDRDAHAWVEAWVDDHWETIDPTPPTPLAPPPASFAGALGDWLRVRWSRVDDWLAERSPPELAFVLIALTGAWLVVRLARRSTRPRESARPADEPLAPWRRFEVAMRSRGIVRPPSETLARFAARVGASDHLSADLRDGATEIVASYEALRYGNLGDAATLERLVNRWVSQAKLQRPSPRTWQGESGE